MKTKVIPSGKIGMLFLIFSMLCAAAPTLGQTTTVEFTNPGGPWVFTVPTGVTSITVQAWGGGGAGASLAAGTTGPALGGGGGAYAEETLTVLAGQEYLVHVGRGGEPYLSNALAGGSGSFSGIYREGTSMLVRAPGGFGGPADPDATPALGGRLTDCLGQVKYAGGRGSYGGGGGAGTTGEGADAEENIGGAGTPLGGGNGGSLPLNPGAGQNGTSSGGGGSGAYGTSDTPLLKGGLGAPGKLLISYLTPVLITAQPSNQTITYGLDATFSIISREPDAFYQWQENKSGQWQDIQGATGRELLLVRPTTLQSGTSYRCMASYESEQEFSQAALLTVDKKTLTALLEALPRCFDGTTLATITTSLSGIEPNDQVSLAYNQAQFADAGPGPTPVTITGLALQGEDAYNYQLDNSDDVTLPDIQIHALPAASISGPEIACINQETELSVSFTGTGPWTFDQRIDDQPCTREGPISENTFSQNLIPTGANTYHIDNISDKYCTNTTTTSFTIPTGPVTYFNQDQLSDLCHGSVFRVDVLVDGFKEVGSVNLTLKYNPETLRFLDHLLLQPQLANFQLTTSTLGDVAIITASGYVGENEAGIDLEDGAALISLEFQYFYSGDGTTLLEWYYHPDDPVHNQYSSNGPDYNPFCSVPHESYFHKGIINGHPLPEVDLVINTLPLSETTNEYCHDSEVSLTLNQIASGTPPFSFTWTTENSDQITTEQAVNINLDEDLFSTTFAEGTHLLNITSVVDVYGCQMPDLSALNTEFIILPEPEVSLVVNLEHSGQEADFESCYDRDIEFTIEGIAGTPEWSFSYKLEGPEGYSHSNTITTETGFSIGIVKGPFIPGIYSFSATSLADETGCSASSSTLAGYAFSIEVLPEPMIRLTVNGIEKDGFYEFLYENQVAVSLQEVISGTGPFSLNWTLNNNSGEAPSGFMANVQLGENVFIQSLDPGIYQLTFTSITDANGCSVNAENLENYTVHIRVFPALTIQGKVFNHHNSPEGNLDLPMSGVAIRLVTNERLAYEAITSQDGTYLFPNVVPGEYEVLFETSLIAGGINATDAALVNYWSVYPSSIEKVQFLVGDVTGFQEPDNLHPDNRLMASDASMIQDYFQSFNGFPFQRGKWTFWPVNEYITENPVLPDLQIHKPSFEVLFGGPSITEDFYGLATGDFNRSHRHKINKSEHEKRVILAYEEPSTIEPGEIFSLPVFADMDMSLGALSLTLSFPYTADTEITDIFLQGDPNKPIRFSRLGDLLRISWFSLEPITLISGDVLLELKVKMLGEMPLGPFTISLADDPLNELADDSFGVITKAMIRTLIFNPSATGYQDPEQMTLSVSNFPNPFGESTVIRYFIPFWGKTTLSLYNLQGVLLGHLVDQYLEAGHHSFRLEGADLAAGAYLIRLAFGNNELLEKSSIMIIRSTR